MSNAVAAQAPAQSVSRAPAVAPPLWLAVLPVVLLFAVAAFLFWISKGDMAGTFGYWQLLIPITAVISLSSGWGQAALNDNAKLLYLFKQVLHWGLLVGLLYVIDTQGIRPLMNDHQYTIVLLYLFGFTTILAALHVDLKMLFFGIFLAFCGYLLAVPDNNPTLVAIGQVFGFADAATSPVAVTVVMALVGCVATLFLLVIMRGALISKKLGEKRLGRA